MSWSLSAILFGALAQQCVAAGLVYTPARDFSGLDEIIITARSSWGEEAQSRIAVVVQPVNDPPEFVEVSELLPENPVYVGAPPTCVLHGLSIQDRDGEAEGPLLLSVSASVGLLTLAPFSAARHGVETVDVDPSESFAPWLQSLGLRARADRLTSLLADCAIQYVAPNRGTATVATLGLRVSDQAGEQQIRKVEISVGSPRLPQVLDCDAMLFEGNSGAVGISMIGGAIDGPDMRIEWSRPSFGGEIRYSNGKNSSIVETPSSLRRAVANGSLVYSPQPFFNGVDYFTLTLKRLDDPSDFVEHRCWVHVRAVNQAPKIAGPIYITAADNANMSRTVDIGGAGWSTQEDVPVALRGIYLEDVDNDEIVVTLTVRNGGANLSFIGWPTGARIWSFNYTTGQLSVAGSTTAVNRALDGLEYTPPEDFSGRAVIAIRVSDEVAFGRDVGLEANALAIVDVQEVDDPVSLNLHQEGGSIRIDEDTALRFGGWQSTGQVGGGMRTVSRIVTLHDSDSPGRDIRVQIVLAKGNGSFTFAGYNEAVHSLDSKNSLALAGTTSDVAQALDDVLFHPSPDWNGLAMIDIDIAPLDSSLNQISVYDPSKANISFSVLVEAVQDDPVVGWDRAKSRYVVEDGLFDDFSDLFVFDADFNCGWFASLSTSAVEVVATTSHGTLFLEGGPHLAAVATETAVLPTMTNSSIKVQGLPQRVTDLLANLLRFRPAPDLYGDAIVDIFVDDRGGYPCIDDENEDFSYPFHSCPDPRTASASLYIEVTPVNDAPRIAVPTTIVPFEYGIVLGREYTLQRGLTSVEARAGNGTKLDGAVAPLSIRDPDSRIVAVDLVTTSGKLRTTHPTPEVEYVSSGAAFGTLKRQLRLLGELEPVNAALSSLVWTADQDSQTRLSDSSIRHEISVVATDSEGLSSTASIVLRQLPLNSVPRISIGESTVTAVFEDQDWTSVFGYHQEIVVEDDDELLTLQASIRDDAELEVHIVETGASSSRNKLTSVHVISVLNATNVSAPVIGGYFTLTVNWTDQLTRQPWLLAKGVKAVTTTDPISFDAVAKISDERRGADGLSRRESLKNPDPDLTGKSVEARLKALENVQAAGIDIIVSRDDYATFDPYDAGGMRYVGTRPRPTTKTGHRWRITLSGASPALINAPIVAESFNLGDTFLVASARRVRAGNAIGGSFSLDIAGSCCAIVAHNGSATDMHRAIVALDAVNAVSVRRSDSETVQGGFRWIVTFIALSPSLEPNSTVRRNPLSIVADSSNLTGIGVGVATRLIRPRVGTPSLLYHVAIDAEPQKSVHAITLAEGGPGFFRLGLDTRNVSLRTGSAAFAAEGSLRWTNPLPRSVVADASDEREGFRVDNRNRVISAYPDHSPGQEFGPPGTSLGSNLKGLPNWKDLGPEASLRVTRHERRKVGSVTWRVTFSNAPHNLPLLHILAVSGDNVQNLDKILLRDVPIFDGRNEARWQSDNTSVTRSQAYAGHAAMKSRIDPTGYASTALELEALPLSGSFRLGWGSDETLSDAIPVRSQSSKISEALGMLPELAHPSPDKAARFVVTRNGPNVAGGYDYWIAFTRKPCILADIYSGTQIPPQLGKSLLRIDASGLSGSKSRSASVKLYRKGFKSGQLRIDYFNKSLAWFSGDYEGDNHISFQGAPDALTNTLRTLELKPPADYSGRLLLDISVADSHGTNAHVDFTLTVDDINDPPFFEWKKRPLSTDAVGFHATFAAELEEDTETIVNGLRVVDVDAGPNETYVVTIIPRHGIVSSRRAPVDPSRLLSLAHGMQNASEVVNAGMPQAYGNLSEARVSAPDGASSAQDGKLVLTGSLTGINRMLETFAYTGGQNWNGFDILSISIAEANGNFTSASELLLRVHPVNDFPVWMVDSNKADYSPSEFPGFPPRAGRGIRQLIDISDHDNYTSIDHNLNPNVWKQFSGSASTVVAARIVFEDDGATVLGNIAVDDPDVPEMERRPLAPFSEECTWPAHLQVDAYVEHGHISLRHGLAVGAAGVLAEMRSSGNLQILLGNAEVGAKSLSFCGQLEAVQCALAALAYSPNPDWNGIDVLKLVAKDGGDAANGAGGPRTSSIIVAIEVVPRPDAPLISLPPKNQIQVLEDVPFVFGVVNNSATRFSRQPFHVTDADLIDRTKFPRRWLLPYTEGNATPRYSSQAIEGVMVLRPNVHSAWRLWAGLDSVETSLGAGAADGIDSYTANISARHGRIALPNARDVSASEKKNRVQVLYNYSLAELNSALFGLVYFPDDNWNSEAEGKRVADIGMNGRFYAGRTFEVITMHVVDGTGEEAYAHFEPTVLAVNDAPVFDSLYLRIQDAPCQEDDSPAITKATAVLNVREDSQISRLGVTVSDVDASDTLRGVLEVTAITSHGKLSFGPSLLASTRQAMAITAGTEGTHMLSFTAEPRIAQDALSAFLYEPEANFAGPDSIILAVSDRGYSGVGGELTDTLSMPVFVDPQCDSPSVLPFPKRAKRTFEDTAVTLGFILHDVDHENLALAYGVKISPSFNQSSNFTEGHSETAYFPRVRVTLTAGNGTLTIQSSTRSALTFEDACTGISEARIMFQAPLMEANRAMQSITYTPRRDYYTYPARPGINPKDIVEAVVDDLGLDGGGLPNGSLCKPLSDSARFFVRIDAVNDRPFIQIPGAIYHAGNHTEISAMDVTRSSDLTLILVKPQIVSEDETLFLGNNLKVIDDSADSDAFPEAFGALSIAVSNGKFAVDTSFCGPFHVLDVDLGPADLKQHRSAAPAHDLEVTFPADVANPSDAFEWQHAAVRWLLRPLEAQRLLATLRFRSLRDAWGNASLTIAYEDGGYGGTAGVPVGVPGCAFCAPRYQVTIRTQASSLTDVKTIPIIIRPQPDAVYFQSPYALGASLHVREGSTVWLQDVRIINPDDAMAQMKLRVSIDKGRVSLRDPPPEELVFLVGDGDTDRQIVAAAPLPAINAALTGLRYTSLKNSSYKSVNENLDLVTLIIERQDLVDYTQTAALTIGLVVEPRLQDGPIIHLANSTRIELPCFAPTRLDLHNRGRAPECGRRVAVATRHGFLEDEPSMAFSDIFVDGVDEISASSLTLHVAVGNGFLSLGSDSSNVAIEYLAGDAIAASKLSQQNLTLRGSPASVDKVFDRLTYVGRRDWHGADILNITVSDSQGQNDFASVVLIVESVFDPAYLEMRVADNTQSNLLRLRNEILDQDGSWERAANAASGVFANFETLEDMKVRLPPLRVRDPDAEANEFSPEAAGLGQAAAAAAIIDSPSGHAVDINQQLRLRIYCNHGQLQLCGQKCPGVGFVAADTDAEEARRASTASLSNVQPPPAEPVGLLATGANSAEISTPGANILSGRPPQRWWTSALLEGTAAALTSALWDWHYWPSLNYNSEAYNSPDDIIRVEVYKAEENHTHRNIDDSMSLRVVIRAMNDAPVVRAPRLETLVNPMSLHSAVAPTTGDGLSLRVLNVEDDVLVTDEDMPLSLSDLFTVRDIDSNDFARPDTDQRLRNSRGGSVEIEIVVTHGVVRLHVPETCVSSVLFVVPTAWGGEEQNHSIRSFPGPWETSGSSMIRFLCTIPIANVVLATLQFVPAPDWHGHSASVRVACSDRGNSGRGGRRSGAQRVIIRVRPSNDKPTIVAPIQDALATHFIDEGGSVRLTGTNFEDAIHEHRRNHPSSMDYIEEVYNTFVPYTHTVAVTHDEYELWRSTVSRPLIDIVDNAIFAAMEDDQESGWRHTSVAGVSKTIRHSSHPHFFSELNGHLYFAANDNGKYGEELMRTDGKIVTLVADILPGRGSSMPAFLTKYAGRLYFGAAGIDDKAWRLPVERADECDGFRQSTFEPRAHFVVADDNVWRPGWTYDCPNGYHWITTAEAGQIFTGLSRGASEREVILDDASFEDLTYFGQCGWRGYEWGGRMRYHFRFADSHISGAYKSAGSPDSRRADLDPVSRSGLTLRIKQFAGIVCLLDDEGEGRSKTGSELWVSDGTPTGTVRAAEIHTGGPHTHANVQYLAVFDGALFFAADDGEHGSEPFRFVPEDNRGRGVARLVIDARRGPEGSNPKFFTSCARALWFTAHDGLHGYELWVSNGSLGFLTRESGDAAHPASFPEVGGGGTRMTADINSGPGDASPESLACLESKILLFAASDGVTGKELWRATINETTNIFDVKLVRDIHPGGSSSNPSYITVFNGRAYFSAEDGEHGVELWSSDGKRQGTRLLKDILPGAASSRPCFHTLVVKEYRLYFFAYASDKLASGVGPIFDPFQAQLWATDGSEIGTYPVYDQTESMIDIDRAALELAWPPRLGLLDGNLFYPARRGGGRLVGGASRGHAKTYPGASYTTQAFAIYDPDDDAVLSLTLSAVPPQSGVLTVGDLSGSRIIHGDGVGDSQFTLKGSIFHLNNAMRSLQFQASAAFNGIANIRARLADDEVQCGHYATENATEEHCQLGVSYDNVTASSSVFIRQINDPPIIDVGLVPYFVHTNEDTVKLLNAILVSDADLAETSYGIDPRTGETIWPRMTVNISLVHGTLTLERVQPRLSFLHGDGIADNVMVFDAMVRDINDALRSLRYECRVKDGCERPVDDSIEVKVDDNGFTGAGGPKQASARISVHVRA